MMMKAFAVGLGLPDNYFDEKFAEPTLALLHYPPHPADTDSWGVGPHTDYGMCTLLLQDDIGGLEVEVTEGQWIGAKPIPGSSDIKKRWNIQRVASVGQRKNLSPRRESNP